MSKASWIDWFDKQSADDQRAISLAAIERLIEIEEVGFRVVRAASHTQAPGPPKGYRLPQGSTIASEVSIIKDEHDGKVSVVR